MPIAKLTGRRLARDKENRKKRTCTKCKRPMKKSKTHSYYCPECERQRTIREMKRK